MFGAPAIPGFAVVGPLGRGGEAFVWAAVEQATGRPVALKRLRTSSADERVRLHREAALLSSLNHPHIVALLGVHDGPDGVVLVLERAEGGSLLDLVMARGALPPGEAVTATGPIAQALAAAHASGLVHGDVTPSNVLFSADGRPLIADLGVARVAGEQPAAVGVTHGFTAPEVLGGAQPTPASDVYGLAVTVRTALVGVLPDDPRAALVKSPPLPATPVSVIEAALGVEPRNRPSAAELADALFRLAAPRPIRLIVPAPDLAAPPVPQAPVTHRSAPAPATSAPPAADGGSGYIGRRARRNPTRNETPPAAAAPSPGSPPVAVPVHQAHPSPHAPTGLPQRPVPERAQPVGAMSQPARRGTPSLAPEDVAAVPEAAQTHRVRREPQREPSRDTAHVEAHEHHDIGRFAVLLIVPALIIGAALLGWQWWDSRRDAEAAPRMDISRPLGEGEGASAALCGGAPSAVPATTPTPAEDWAVVVDDLYTQVAAAYTDADPAELCLAYVPTSKGLEVDQAKINEYVRVGAHAQGMDFIVHSAEVITAEPTRVVLEITDELPAYDIVDKDGVVRGTGEALPQQTWKVELLPSPDGTAWRFG